MQLASLRTRFNAVEICQKLSILIGLGNGKTIFEITQVSNENMQYYSELVLRLKNMQVKLTRYE